MFQLHVLMATIRLDNPTYEKHVRSSLHNLVAILSRNAPAYTAAEVATEMKKIMRAEPGKFTTRYTRTKAYLLQEIPGLPAAIRGSVVNFKTRSMVKGPNGSIVHTLAWGSDTGSLVDLGHVRVRELVSWPTPVAPVIPAQHIIPPAPLENYRVAGQHAGVGNAAYTPGTTGQGNDTHSAMGPFAPAALNYNGGAPLVVTFDQVYQTSVDNGGNWVDIPASRYTITRELRSVGGGRVQIKLTKANATVHADKLSNSHTL